MLDVLLEGRQLLLGLGRGVAEHEYASLGIPREQSRVLLRDPRRPAPGGQRGAVLLRGRHLPRPADHGSSPAPPQGPPPRRRPGRLHHQGIGRAGRRGGARPDVRGRRAPRGHDPAGRPVQRHPGPEGSPPTSRRHSCGCTAPRPRPRSRRATATSSPSSSTPRTTTSTGTRAGSRACVATRNTPPRARTTWTSGRQTSGSSARPNRSAPRPDHRQDPGGPRGRQPGLPGHPHLLRRHAGRKAERSLRLFAKEVLPALHEMATPIHEHSLGLPAAAAAEAG